MLITKNKKIRNKGERAFSLIETFIAITVLLIAISGPLVLITQSLSSIKVVKNRMTAVYLTQEVFEYVRNVRDNNILNGRNWLAGLDDCLLEGQKCKIDSPDETISACSPSGCQNLKYNPETLLYNYDPNEDESLFRRDTSIEVISPDKEIKIIVDVYWVEGPRERKFSTENFLLNWQ